MLILHIVFMSHTHATAGIKMRSHVESLQFEETEKLELKI